MTDVIIIGAGVGGLSCAAYLAKAGLDVSVLEASDRVGGCCKTTDQDGFSFEDGSLWNSMDYLCHQHFSELGFDFDGMVPNVRLDPTTRCILPDGKDFYFIPDKERMAAEVARISSRDVPGFYRFMEEMERRSEFVSGEIYNTPLTWRSLLKPALWRQTTFLLGTYQKWLYRYIESENVRLGLCRPTLFLGFSPWRCPAPFLLSAYGEITSGLSYPLGGMQRIPEALETIVLGFNGTVRTNTSVDRILIDEGRAVGVQTTQGETIRARMVISNAHVQTTYLNLVGREKLRPRVVKRLESLDVGHSYFGVQLGLDYSAQGTANNASIPPFSEMDEFWHGIDHPLTSKLHPNVLITPADSSVAPSGRSVVCIYHVAHHDPDPAGWGSIKEEFAQRLMERAEEICKLPLKDHIVTQRLITPIELEKDFRLPRGGMYGLALNFSQSGPFRPANRSPWIRNLYLTGQTTQPGLGVASVLASGAMTAKLVLSDS
jgi:phytoene desaturase